MPATSQSYIPPEVPADESERLEALYELKLLDTASELRFDRYTSLVADIFGFPIVLVTFVDRERQWFKSSRGLDLRETSRDLSFCAHAITQRGVMVIRDTHEDPRFAGNPLVTGPPNIRFYAGAIVHSPRGQPLGTLCTLDHEPRNFGDKQCKQLRHFADLVENEIRHSYDLESLRSSVQFSAYYDPLTRLPNRRLLTDRLSKLIELSERDESQVAVLLFNISAMRLLNQSFGTETGDDLLTQVGERLRTCCPLGGTVARLQADEFVLAFPTSSCDTDQFDLIVNDARLAMDKPFLSSGGEHYLHVQIGGSVCPEHGSTPAALIERASAAIRFKDNSYGSIRFFSQAESISISERLQVESNLRGAVENKERFHLVYQPIVSLEDGTLHSVEALLRWTDPELGEVSPDLFIPIAEQTGLILAIGRWVRDQACRQLDEWRANGDWDISVAINVAAPELLQTTFAHTLLRRLNADGTPPGLISVEVTERSLVSDAPQVDQNMKLLCQAAIPINIDDFGTGYSSLACLRRMPTSRLKIDRSFVAGLPTGKHDIALTQTVLSMASALGLGTIAEGVENREQLDFLREAGCHYVQGFYVARPLPPEKIPELRHRQLI